MHGVAIRLGRYRRKLIGEMLEVLDRKIRAKAGRLARQFQSEHGDKLTAANKAAIERKARIAAEREAYKLRAQLMIQVELEVEAERERLNMKHCPPDTPDGVAARAVNGKRARDEADQQREQRDRRELERAERRRVRQEDEAEKRAAIAEKAAQRAMQKLAKEERELAAALAFRDANPPAPKFAPGEEPVGWETHMDRGATDRHWLSGVPEQVEGEEEPAADPSDVHPTTLALYRRRRKHQIP